MQRTWEIHVSIRDKYYHQLQMVVYRRQLHHIGSAYSHVFKAVFHYSRGQLVEKTKLATIISLSRQVVTHWGVTQSKFYCIH